MVDKSVRVDFLGRDVSLSRTAGRAGKSLGGLLGRLKGFGGGLGLALGGAALIKFGADSISMAADFDKSMRQVAAVTKTPASGLKGLKKLALDFGASTSFSARQAGEAMLELAKGGMTVAQIRAGGLKETLTLAAAGGLELGDAARTMSGALNAFRIPAKKAWQASSALAGAANASTASVEDLTLALAQVGPGARNAGLDLNDTVGVLAAFHNWGLKGSDAGTSLKTMLQRLIPTTKAAKDEMKDLGLKFTDAQGSFLPITEIAQQLQDKLKGLSQAQKAAALQTIFGSDATRAATVLMNEGAGGIAKYIKATKDRDAAEKLAKTNTSGAAGAFERLKGAIETVRLTLADGLLPAFADVANWLSSRLPGWLANLESWWKRNRLAVQGLANALGYFVNSSGKAEKSGLTLKGTLSGLLTVARLGATGLLYLAIAAQRVTQGFSYFGEGIGHLINAVDKLSGGTGHAGDTIVRTWRDARSKAVGQIAEIRSQINRLNSAIASVPNDVPIRFRVVGGIPAVPRKGARPPSGVGGRTRAYASGGVLREPVAGLGMRSGARYLLGERGPEAVTPLRGAMAGAPTINVYGVTDPAAVAKRVRDELVRFQNRNGTTGLR